MKISEKKYEKLEKLSNANSTNCTCFLLTGSRHKWAPRPALLRTFSHKLHEDSTVLHRITVSLET